MCVYISLCFLAMRVFLCVVGRAGRGKREGGKRGKWLEEGGEGKVVGRGDEGESCPSNSNRRRRSSPPLIISAVANGGGKDLCIKISL